MPLFFGERSSDRSKVKPVTRTLLALAATLTTGCAKDAFPGSSELERAANARKSFAAATATAESFAVQEVVKQQTKTPEQQAEEERQIKESEEIVRKQVEALGVDVIEVVFSPIIPGTYRVNSDIGLNLRSDPCPVNNEPVKQLSYGAEVGLNGLSWKITAVADGEGNEETMTWAMTQDIDGPYFGCLIDEEGNALMDWIR